MDLSTKHQLSYRALKLDCPACAIEITDIRQIDGKEVRCPHCGKEAMLSHEWQDHSASCSWELSENGDNDEP